jgi:hypothetical protein
MGRRVDNSESIHPTVTGESRGNFVNGHFRKWANNSLNSSCIRNENRRERERQAWTKQYEVLCDERESLCLEAGASLGRVRLIVLQLGATTP